MLIISMNYSSAEGKNIFLCEGQKKERGKK